MIDRELFLELSTYLYQILVARIAIRHDKVSCERCLRCAQGPDVEIVQLPHAGPGGEIVTDSGELDAGGNGCQRHRHAVTQKAPGSLDNDRVDDEADHGIKPEPARQQNYQSGNDDTG